MKDQVKTPVIVVVAIVVIGLVVFFAMKALGSGNLDQGQVKYTPGVPPWMEKDPSKRGPGTTASGSSGGPGQPGQPGQGGIVPNAPPSTGGTN